MTEFFTGRSENSIKNRFYSALRKEASKNIDNEIDKIALYKMNCEDLLKYFSRTFAEKQKLFQLWAETNDKGGQAYLDSVEELLINKVFNEKEKDLKFMEKIRIVAPNREQIIEENLVGEPIAKINVMTADERMLELVQDLTPVELNMRQVEEKIDCFFNAESGGLGSFGFSKNCNQTVVLERNKLVKEFKKMEDWLENALNTIKERSNHHENEEKKDDIFYCGSLEDGEDAYGMF